MRSFDDLLNEYSIQDLKPRLSLIPSHGTRPTRKADIVATIRDYLLSPQCRQLWNELDELEQSAIAEALHHWHGVFVGSRFLAIHDDLPELFKPRQYGRGTSKLSTRKAYLSLFLYNGQIPAELSGLLTKFVPLPSQHTITTVAEDDIANPIPSGSLWGQDDTPDGSVRLLNTEVMARQELAAMLRLVESGRLAVSEKTGMAGAAALKRIDGLLTGGDYYDPEEDWIADKTEGSPLRPIRPFAWPLLLQAGGLAKPKGKTLELTRKGKAALRAPFEQTIREIYTRWRDKGRWDEFRRIEQIKGQTSKKRPMAAANERRQAIEKTLIELPPGEWVDLQVFYRYSIAQGHYFQVARNEWALYILDANYGNMGYAPDSLLDTRYLMVYFMEYLATLGMLDIGYTHADSGIDDLGGLWGVDELVYLSRYDGLLYLRLNPLGAYCLGLSEDYELELPETEALLDVDAALQLHLRRPADAAEGMQLQQFALPLGANEWRLTRDSLLAAAGNGLSLDDFHLFLQQNSASEPPAALATLFEECAARSTAVTDAGSARLLKCATSSLAAALARDPKVAPYCLHAGGRMLVVPSNKLSGFRKVLRAKGYAIVIREQGPSHYLASM